MTMTEMSAPLTIGAVRPPVDTCIKSWARTSLRPCSLEDVQVPEGTCLWRSGGEWDSFLAVALARGNALFPLLVFKNPVPLWQSSQSVADGPVTSTMWPRLREDILLHNPGLTGFLVELDRIAGQEPRPGRPASRRGESRG